MEDGSTQPQVCTECHRIGTRHTCKTRVPWYTAQRFHDDLNTDRHNYLDSARMPPTDPSWSELTETEAEAQWTDQYSRHVEMLQCCCEDPSRQGCLTYGHAPGTPPFQVGSGPETCHLDP